MLDLENVNVKFTQSQIVIENKELLDLAIESVVNQYKNMVVTEETLKSGKKSRAELNKLKKALDDRRKEIKKQFNEPLKNFESELKKYTTKIDELVSQIDLSVKEIEDAERDERKKYVEELISEMAPNYNLNVDEIEIDTTWLNKSVTKSKLTKLVGDEMTLKNNLKKEIESKKLLIETQCELAGLDPIGFNHLIELAPIEIIEEIKNTARLRNERNERTKAIEKAKMQAELAQLTQVGNKLVNQETGEVKSEVKHVDLTIELTADQLTKLEMYLKFNHIEVIEKSVKELIK